jgi:hypothetical protein
MEIDCGNNALDLAFTNVANESLPGVLGGGLAVMLVLYIAAILPSVLYRIVLYVAKGAAWRPAKRHLTIHSSGCYGHTIRAQDAACVKNSPETSV